MAYEVVREVTQPFHGADGIEVLYQPGDRVGVDEDLPYGVRTALVVAEVPDKPAPKGEAKAPAAAKSEVKATAKVTGAGKGSSPPDHQ